MSPSHPTDPDRPVRHRFGPPIEPSAGGWIPRLRPMPPGEEIVGIGGDLAPGAVLAAYRAGMFPMGLGPHGSGPLGWWSPDPRGVLLPGGLRVSRSLRKSLGHFHVTIDRDFEAVLHACADPGREGRWITPDIIEAYLALNELGWAHSVEVWLEGRLAGGLYGLSVGGLFAGESMFHHVRDASKVALVALVEAVADDGDGRRFIDVQWATPHLASLGVIEVAREEYLCRLHAAAELEVPAAMVGRSPLRWSWERPATPPR